MTVNERLHVRWPEPNTATPDPNASELA